MMTCFLIKRNAVLPISLHNLLCATGDGFRSSVLCFLLLGLPIVCSALSGVVFCLDFSPFFFLLLFHCHVFFPLFIYLFSLTTSLLPNTEQVDIVISQ
jgi:hypothetical protein